MTLAEIWQKSGALLAALAVGCATTHPRSLQDPVTTVTRTHPVQTKPPVQTELDDLRRRVAALEADVALLQSTPRATDDDFDEDTD